MSLESGQSLLCDMDEITPLIRSLVTNGEDLCEYGEELPTDWEDKMRVLVDKLVLRDPAHRDGTEMNLLSRYVCLWCCNPKRPGVLCVVCLDTNDKYRTNAKRYRKETA